VHGILHLAENLWLTDDERVQTAGHSIQMPDGLGPRMEIETRKHCARFERVPVLQKLQKDAFRRSVFIEQTGHFNAVAGGKDNAVQDTIEFTEGPQGRRQPVRLN
jgi:hypothetical protein